MDIHMPRMDGLEATRRIMAEQPLPIIVVSSSWQPAEVTLTFRAMDAGAVALAEKPRGPAHPEGERIARHLVQTVKAMAGVRVLRRKPAATQRGTPSPSRAARPSPAKRTGLKVVAMGASTGGPPALARILSRLPSNFAAPILIVQHIAEGFLPGLAKWLAEETRFPIHIASDNEPALPGRAFLAPDGAHMGLDPQSRIMLSSTAPPENGLRPSVSYLFRSVLSTCGPACAGVLLTGMGRDGAAELKTLRDAGAVTIVQDEASSVVFGMPGEALRLGAATHGMPPERIAEQLIRLVNEAPA
jgi:two-component system chemotaxis response regulator CheB